MGRGRGTRRERERGIESIPLCTLGQRLSQKQGTLISFQQPSSRAHTRTRAHMKRFLHAWDHCRNRSHQTVTFGHLVHCASLRIYSRRCVHLLRKCAHLDAHQTVKCDHLARPLRRYACLLYVNGLGLGERGWVHSFVERPLWVRGHWPAWGLHHRIYF